MAETFDEVIYPGFPPFIPFPVTIFSGTARAETDIEHTNLYLYSHIKPWRNLTLTLGASGDFFESDEKEAYDAVRDAYNSGIDNLGELRVNREDAVLKIIAKDGKPIDFIEYGGNHAFGGIDSFEDYDYTGRDLDSDNLARWNSLHPDMKFSLIEVIPKSYGLKDEK